MRRPSSEFRSPTRRGSSMVCRPGSSSSSGRLTTTTACRSPNSGRWSGPRYEERGNPANAGFASLDWSVSFDERQGDAEAVSLANVVHRDWQRDQRGGLGPTRRREARRRNDPRVLRDAEARGRERRALRGRPRLPARREPPCHRPVRGAGACDRRVRGQRHEHRLELEPRPGPVALSGFGSRGTCRRRRWPPGHSSAAGSSGARSSTGSWTRCSALPSRSSGAPAEAGRRSTARGRTSAGSIPCARRDGARTG